MKVKSIVINMFINVFYSKIIFVVIFDLNFWLISLLIFIFILTSDLACYVRNIGTYYLDCLIKFNIIQIIFKNIKI